MKLSVITSTFAFFGLFRTGLGCGVNQRPPQDQLSVRIIGGEASSPGEWPWQISLQLRNPVTGKSLGHHCGGALISHQWILTAAHCVVDPTLKFPVPAKFWSVRMGETDFGHDEGTERVRKVKRIVVHEAFKPRLYSHDVALLELDKAVDLRHTSPFVNSICLPLSGHSLTKMEGKNCTVTGWGRTKLKGEKSPLLLKTQLPIIPSKNCSELYKHVGKITDSMICAGFERGGYGACIGDSGGPLQCQMENGRWYLAGIVSWGVGCAEPRRPGVYVKVSAYIDWIRKRVGESTNSVPRRVKLPWVSTDQEPSTVEI